MNAAKPGRRYPGVITKAQQTVLLASLKNRLQSWFSQWFVTDDEQANLLDFDHIEFNQQLFTTAEYRLKGEQIVLQDEQLCCYLTEHLPQRLGYSGLNLNPDAEGLNEADRQLAKTIGEQMRLGLGEALAVNQQMSSAPFTDTVLPVVCHISMVLPGMRMDLLLTAAGLQRFVGGQFGGQLRDQHSANTLPNINLKQLVADAMVTLPLRLHSQAVSVRQLLSLQPGHVIPLTQQLSEPLMVGQTGVVSLTGHLIKRDGNNAVFLTGVKHD